MINFKKNKNKTENIDDENLEINKDEYKEISKDKYEALIEKNPYAYGRPQNLIIGFVEEITKKGLKEYIVGQVYKYFPSPHYTVYRIEKYNNGFIYEIHDGGKKVTYLKKIKDNLNQGENEIILKTNGDYVKVAKAGNRIDCIILQEEEVDAKLIDKMDVAKMEEAVPLGAGVFLTGLMMLSFGVISLFFAVLFKYGILNKEAVPVVQKINFNNFYRIVENLPAPTTNNYVKNITYNDVSKTWECDMKGVKISPCKGLTKKPQEVKKLPNVPVRLPNNPSNANKQEPLNNNHISVNHENTKLTVSNSSNTISKNNVNSTMSNNVNKAMPPNTLDGTVPMHDVIHNNNVPEGGAKVKNQSDNTKGTSDLNTDSAKSKDTKKINPFDLNNKKPM